MGQLSSAPERYQEAYRCESHSDAWSDARQQTWSDYGSYNRGSDVHYHDRYDLRHHGDTAFGAPAWSDYERYRPRVPAPAQAAGTGGSPGIREDAWGSLAFPAHRLLSRLFSGIYLHLLH